MPDPDLHATSTFAVATGQFANEAHDVTDAYGNVTKAQTLTGESAYLDINGYRNILISAIIAESVQQIDPMIGVQREPSATGTDIVSIPREHHANRSNQYLPINYIPQALGLRIGMWLHFHAFEAWQTARLSNLLVFIVMFSIAIALLPKAKFVFVVIGILPTSAFIASSLMGDAMILWLSACFVGLFVRVVENNKQIGTATSCVLGAITVLLFFSKVVYFLVALLVIVLPKNIMQWRGKIIYCSSVLLISLPVYGLWQINYSGQLSQVNISDNMSYALSHIFTFVGLLLTNVLRLPKMIFDTPMPWLYLSFAAALFVSWLIGLVRIIKTNIADGWKAITSSLRYVIVSVVVAAGVCAAVYLSMAITWNDLSQLNWTSNLNGFQGRYVLPLLPLVAIAYATHSESSSKSRIMRTAE